MLGAVVWTLAACSHPTEPQESEGAAPVAAEDIADTVLPSSSAYAGAARCSECHEKRHAGWARDWHSRALTPASPETAVGRFPAHFQGTSSEAWMRREGSKYLMRTSGADGAIGDFENRWLIGGKRMQDPITVLPDGRWQVLPIYYHVTGGAWVDYTEVKQGRLTPDHAFFWSNWRRNANHECLDCHTTGLDVRYDRRARAWTTEMADAGVACESCHGPGARHAETKEKADIVHPGQVSKEAGLAICGQCHGPRTPLFPILDAVHRFRPGQAYDDYYQALAVVAGDQRSPDFFADGRPRTSSYEYQALVQSRCYLQGQATCLTCHGAPHDEHGSHELRIPDAKARAGSPLTPTELAALPDASCRQCHAGIVAEGAGHTRHRAAAAQRCVACHMPKVVSGVLDHFADHALDVPVPENTIRHDVPNACTACHEKEPASVMAEALHRLWPNAAARQERRRRLADAIDESTAADSLGPLGQVVTDRSEAPILRGAAAQLLAQRFPQAASGALVALLDDPSPVVRAQAVEALGMAGAKDTAPAIARKLDDPVLPVRHVAALVLSSFGDPRAEPALRRLANTPATEGLVQPHVALGTAALRAGDLPAAQHELEKAADLMPYYTGALVLLADTHARQRQGDEARERLEQALSFEPRNVAALARIRAMTR